MWAFIIAGISAFNEDSKEADMLYDKKWDAKTERQVYTLANLIAWLEIMPPDERYRPERPGSCLLGQWASAMGAKNPGHMSIRLDSRRNFSRIAIEEGPFTFGDALKRARAVLTSA